jgi:UDP:flavonoid glycosyltransferase YjiC (YdhE family)
MPSALNVHSFIASPFSVKGKGTISLAFWGSPASQPQRRSVIHYNLLCEHQCSDFKEFVDELQSIKWTRRNQSTKKIRAFPMKITILALGSRGDVQPYTALGVALQIAGFEVRLATHDLFVDFVRSYGLEFFPVEGNPQEIVQGERGRAWLETERNPFLFASGFRELMGPVLRQAMSSGLQACRDAEAIIFGGPAYYIGYSLAKKLNLPYIQAYLQPVHPTRALPSALFPTPIKGPGIYNYLSHILGGALFWQLLLPTVNAAREEFLNLPPLNRMGPFPEMQREKRPVVYGFSPVVIPKPADWAAWIHITGYWFLQERPWSPPPELVEFLAVDKPAIYFGFGSMANRDPERITGIVLEALQITGMRGIILSGWGGLRKADLPENVLMLAEVPHSWLFPRVAAVVHHGGAGTTAAGLRAGKPAVIVPFFGDQAFWGDRLHALGVGPAPISQKELTPMKLAQAILSALETSEIHKRAVQLGDQIRAEDGAAQAAELIRQQLLG